MPNGGSDCCGTCWFNRTNQGRGDRTRHADESIPPYCEIRDLAIEDPFYTYCANHPYRRPERDPIPIGPVLRHGGFQSHEDPDGTIVVDDGGRYVWKPSPDSEEVRQHLLDLLDNLFEHLDEDDYPLGIGLGETVIRQLGEFREQRAVRYLEWIRDNLAEVLEDLAGVAIQALEEIRSTE